MEPYFAEWYSSQQWVQVSRQIIAASRLRQSEAIDMHSKVLLDEDIGGRHILDVIQVWYGST